MDKYVVKNGPDYADGCRQWVISQKDAMVFTDEGAAEAFSHDFMRTGKQWAIDHAKTFLGLATRVVKLVPRK